MGSEGCAEGVFIRDVEDDLAGVHERVDGFERREGSSHNFVLKKGG
jgi:hypothetical protein